MQAARVPVHGVQMSHTLNSLLNGYVRWRSSIGAPGVDPVESEGLVYDKKCSACPSKLRHVTASGPYVCGHCGEPWGATLTVRLRGTFQENRTPGPPTRHDRWIDVGVVVAQYMIDAPMPARVVLERAVLDRSQRELAGLLSEETGEPWSIRRIRETDEEGRQELLRRFADRGVSLRED